MLVFLVACASSIVRGATITVFSDNFQTDSVGASPGTPSIGLPWQVTQPVANGAIIMADPWTTGNHMLQFGPDYDTALAPLTAAGQAAVAINGNATLNFSFHGSISSGWVSSFDAGIYAPNGSIATLIRIEPQTTGGTANIHSIYYLSPSSGLIDSGLTIAGDSWQNVSLTANVAGDSAQLTVGSNTETLPLYTCPSMLADAEFTSYAMGGGGSILGSGAIENVTVTSQGIAAYDESTAPEPGTMVLLIAGACTGGLVWFLKRRRVRTVG
jgi:hypothetical protein